MAAKKIKVEGEPILKDGEFDVTLVKELNFFDLTGEKSRTKGSSNKFYRAELNVEKNGGRTQIFTMYGPTGRVQRKEWRIFDNYADAEKEFNRLIKSKLKKGYVEIDLAQRALGSEEAKKIIKPVKLKNVGEIKAKTSLNEGQKKNCRNSFWGAGTICY